MTKATAQFYRVYKTGIDTGYIDGWYDTEAQARQASLTNPYASRHVIVRADSPQDALKKAGVQL